jgi:hypothetical protein
VFGLVWTLYRKKVYKAKRSYIHIMMSYYDRRADFKHKWSSPKNKYRDSNSDENWGLLREVTRTPESKSAKWPGKAHQAPERTGPAPIGEDGIPSTESSSSEGWSKNPLSYLFSPVSTILQGVTSQLPRDNVNNTLDKEAPFYNDWFKPISTSIIPFWGAALNFGEFVGGLFGDL